MNAALDLAFVRAEVACCYGFNGHVSVDPVVRVKLMILLFLEDIPSERELMGRLAERLDSLCRLRGRDRHFRCPACQLMKT